VKLLKYLRHVRRVDRLRPPPRQWATEFDMRDVDRTTARLMELTAVRSPAGVKVLSRRRRADATHLAASLPVLWRPRRRSLLSLIRRAGGLLEFDPMRGEYQRRKRR
jgi:hypothetical protein